MKKDPHTPTKPRTAYTFYLTDSNNRQQMRDDNITVILNHTDINFLLSAHWKLMEETHKKVYQVMAADDVIRYDRAMNEYNNNTITTNSNNHNNKQQQQDEEEDGIEEVGLVGKDSKIAVTDEGTTPDDDVVVVVATTTSHPLLLSTSNDDTTTTRIPTDTITGATTTSNKKRIVKKKRTAVGSTAPLRKCWSKLEHDTFVRAIRQKSSSSSSSSSSSVNWKHLSSWVKTRDEKQTTRYGYANFMGIHANGMYNYWTLEEYDSLYDYIRYHEPSWYYNIGYQKDAIQAKLTTSIATLQMKATKEQRIVTGEREIETPSLSLKHALKLVEDNVNNNNNSTNKNSENNDIVDNNNNNNRNEGTVEGELEGALEERKIVEMETETTAVLPPSQEEVGVLVKVVSNKKRKESSTVLVNKRKKVLTVVTKKQQVHEHDPHHFEQQQQKQQTHQKQQRQENEEDSKVEGGGGVRKDSQISTISNHIDNQGKGNVDTNNGMEADVTDTIKAITTTNNTTTTTIINTTTPANNNSTHKTKSRTRQQRKDRPVFVGRPRKKKKDPKTPTKPRSARTFYLNDSKNRQQVKDNDPTVVLNSTNIDFFLSAQWKVLKKHTNRCIKIGQPRMSFVMIVSWTNTATATTATIITRSNNSRMRWRMVEKKEE